jgi:hypothetical protein
LVAALPLWTAGLIARTVAVDAVLQTTIVDGWFGFHYPLFWLLLRCYYRSPRWLWTTLLHCWDCGRCQTGYEPGPDGLVGRVLVGFYGRYVVRVLYFSWFVFVGYGVGSGLLDTLTRFMH